MNSNTKRKLIIVGAGVTVLLVSYGISELFASKETPPRKAPPKGKVSVFAQEVENDTIYPNLSATGPVMASQSIELYAEVQGLMNPGTKPFKPGVSFQKGEILLQVSTEDKAAELISQRTQFQALIMSVLPDLELDYPDQSPEWKSYALSIKPDQSLPDIPKIKEESLKRFLIGQNVLSRYYTLRNLEINFSKRTLRAPFSGLLAEANANPGTLIRPGQRLGKFIQPGDYELELAIPFEQAKRLKLGDPVNIFQSTFSEDTLVGKIKRINQTIDQGSQTLQVYVEIKGDQVQDGMYLRAELPISPYPNALEVNRNLVFNENEVFIVQDGKLSSIQIQPLFYTSNTVVISGVRNGTQLVTKRVPGGFSGMPVEIIDEKDPS